jgi:TetR/AcrR family transcriptional repressor of mexJK operon
MSRNETVAFHLNPDYISAMDKLTHDGSDCPGKAPGRPKAADVEARTQELLHVAGELFLKNGYTKTSLEAIARAAHVAVRTIYVKFGGKAGLLQAVMAAKRDRSFRSQPMDTDPRPLREIVDEFALQFHEMVNSPEAIALQRVVITEAPTSPELAEVYWNGGPRLTREMLARFFARPDIRAQMRPDVPADLLPGYLISCILGDFATCFIHTHPSPRPNSTREDMMRRLELFYRGILPG